MTYGRMSANYPDNTGPRVLEIQLCQNISGYQFATESKPKLSAIRTVNKEARHEFLRIYTPITLNRHLAVTPVSPALARSFFSPAKDTVYIVESRNAPTPYAKPSVWFLNRDFLANVRHLAIQGESFTCDEFHTVPPYNLITFATLKKATILKVLLENFPQLKTLSVVVGDDFSLAPNFLAAISDFTRKPAGELELTELIRSRQATDKYCSAEDQVLEWMQFLLEHFTAAPNEPEVRMCQALRGGILAMIDVLGLLETRD